MTYHIDSDAILGEQNPDFEEFAGLSRPDEDGQGVVTLIGELVDVVNHGMLDLFHRVPAFQRGVRNPHLPTLVAQTSVCNQSWMPWSIRCAEPAPA